MAILDLQGMKPSESQHSKGGSKGSKGCGAVVIGGGSGLSLLLC